MSNFRSQFPPEGVVIWRDLQHVLDRVQDKITEVIADRVRIEVVTELPASAGINRMFRMAGDPAIYVGNGPGNPLRKITTEPL